MIRTQVKIKIIVYYALLSINYAIETVLHIKVVTNLLGNIMFFVAHSISVF